MSAGDKTEKKSGYQSVNISGSGDILILREEDVSSLLSMSEVIGLMNEAFISLKKKQCHVPLRSVVASQDQKVNLFFKPAFDNNLSNFSVKLLTQNESNKKRGAATINGIVVLMDRVTAEIVSIMDGNSITSLRTGAVAGLASGYLARDNSSELAIFGCGAQGRTQLRAISAVRDITKVYLFDNDQDAIKQFIEEMQPGTEASLLMCSDLDALKDVDIISTATGSATPLFGLEHIKPGVHINAIGAYKPDMQEIAPDIVKAASLFVDQREACLKEPGDILIPLKSGLISEDHIQAELGDLACQDHPGRKSDKEISLFKSVGIAIQDLYLANMLYNKAMSG